MDNKAKKPRSDSSENWTEAIGDLLEALLDLLGSILEGLGDS